MKYFRIIQQILHMSRKKTLIYKYDLIFGFITTIIWFIVQIYYLKFMFQAGQINQLNGFSRGDLYLVLSLGQIIFGLFFIFIQGNFVNIFEQVHTGKLDTYLLKPMNSHLALQLQEIYCGSLLIFIYPIIGIFYFAIYYSISLNVIQIFEIIFVLINSILVLYFIYLLAISLCFYVDRFAALWIFIHNISDISRYPKAIYPLVIQIGLTFMLPLFISINPIYNILNHTFTLQFIGQMLLITLYFGIISWNIRTNGLKKYNSAN